MIKHYICSLLLCVAATWAEAGAQPDFQGSRPCQAATEIDNVLLENWRHAGLRIPNEAPDAVFLRRARLTLTGQAPSPDEQIAYEKDPSPGKQAKLIDRLLASDDFVQLLAMRLGDRLRIKSEFPINLWPNAVQLYNRFLTDAIRTNMPYSDFARMLLTASGSNFRVPAANFFRAVSDRSPAGLADAASRMWEGVPYSELPPDARETLLAVCRQIHFKNSAEWKEEFVYTDLPDPRPAYADALTDAAHPRFARAAVNLFWEHLFGADLNAPENKPVLDALALHFVIHNYDVRELLRTMTLSAAFRAAPVSQDDPAAARRVFAAYPVRRLDAEVISDRLSDLTGVWPAYTSVIPEPFTFLPRGTRAIAIGDGSIGNGFLELFGRPPRDSGDPAERNNLVTAKQRLHLLNSGTLYRQCSSLPWRLFRQKKLNDRQRADLLYRAILSRAVSDTEWKIFDDYRKTLWGKTRNRAWSDLAWALVNAKEFLYLF